MPTFIHGSGGASGKINGTVVSKIVNPASVGVNKGDFIKAIEDNLLSSTLKEFETNQVSNVQVISLSKDIAILCYVNTSTNQLIVKLITVSDTEITFSNKLALAGNMSISNVVITRLTDTKAIVCYRFDNEKMIKGRVLEYNGTLLIVGSEKTLFAYSTIEAKDLTIARANDNAALLCFIYDGAGYGCICNTNGNVIQETTSVQVLPKANYCKIVSSFDDLFYIFHTDGTGKLQCSFIEIFGSSIMLDWTIAVDSSVTAGMVNAIKLDDRHAMVIYRQSLLGKCAVVNFKDGLQVINKSDVTNVLDANFSIARVNENKAVLLYKNSTNTLVKIITFDNGIIRTDKVHAAYDTDARIPSSIAISDTKVLVAFQNFTNSSKGACNVLTTNSYVDKAASNEILYGVAKTGGKANETIEVIVP